MVVNRRRGGMQRRGGSEQPVKGQRHKTIRPKARKAPTAPASADHSAEQFDRLKRERDEALEQLAATSGVLEAISKSTFDLKAVLQGLVESAARLCKADKAAITRQIGGEFFFTETYGLSSEFIEHVRTVPVKPKRGTVSGLALLEGRTIHVSDLRVPRDDIWAKAQKLGGFRTMLGVPMLREGTPIGVLALVRTEAQPFTNKQIELVQNFAAQAVIAIENTRLLSELRQRTDDLSESLEQQTATSEVLKVISSSPGELKPVFDTMLINAMQVCEAKFGFMHRYEDDNWETMALQCDVPAYAEFVQKARFGPESIVGRIASTKQVAQVADITATQRYADRDPLAVAAAEIGGVRTILGVPVLKENEVKGAIILYRQEVRPFTNKQIELVQNFAAQAVIAIENARLLSELRESLQQQTATADVLKVISSSPGDLGPVFDTMLANAVHVCGANFGIMHRYDGGAFCNVAMHNVPPAFAEMRRSNPVIRPSPGTGLGRVERTKKVVQILDLKSEQTYRDRVPATVAMVELAGARTLLLVPMLKDDVLLGTIAIYRQEVRPFSDKQIELVENFSAQAVIAIENTRLLNELRESLEQQTATSEVLKVISSSPGELEPVFNAMLANATRICEATIGTLYLREGSRFRGVALHHSKQSYVDFWRRNPVVDVEKNPGIPLYRLARTKRVVHIPDLRTDQSYIEKNDRVVVLVEQGDVRTFVAVPMLKEGELIGAINLYRQEVQPFTDKQIGLVQNFAAQAVIAIENTRLLSELRESLQQQTATADVLKVISRSAFDLNAVLHALIEAAARLCDADHGNIARERDGVYQRVATYGYSDDFTKHLMNLPVIPDRGTGTGRSLLEGKVVHIHDVRADPEYTFVEAQKRGDFRTVLSVPMLREGTTIGILALTRRVVRPFTDKQIELVRTFADQAAIAIENVRLFESVEARTRELAKSLEDLRNTQDRLVQTQKLASLGQLTAGIAHEIKNPLNFVNNFSAVSVELIDELRQALTGAHLDTKLRAEISEIADTLQGNLDKVVQHGKRADAIVKNMLLHSREGSGEHRPVDINALVEESLNLAYHGARAEKQGFNITLERSLDPAAGQADVFPQDITRVLLNLISNGFYAVTKRKAQADGDGYEPTLAAGTRSLGDRVEISVRDNGTGIPPEVKEKMFNPFFTTKPAGEGTGLGLSISHDIIVKQHGGSIEVDTKPGEFTKIRIILPRAAMLSTERA